MDMHTGGTPPESSGTRAYRIFREQGWIENGSWVYLSGGHESSFWGVEGWQPNLCRKRWGGGGGHTILAHLSWDGEQREESQLGRLGIPKELFKREKV